MSKKAKEKETAPGSEPEAVKSISFLLGDVTSTIGQLEKLKTHLESLLDNMVDQKESFEYKKTFYCYLFLDDALSALLESKNEIEDFIKRS